MITYKTMQDLWQVTHDTIDHVDIECDCEEAIENGGYHSIPVDIMRKRTRFGIGRNSDNEIKRAGNSIAHIARIVIGTNTVFSKRRQFLDHCVINKDRKKVSGFYATSTIEVNFVADDWYDLFGNDIAWEMGNLFCNYLLDHSSGLWDGVLETHGARLERNDPVEMYDGIIPNENQENIYQVSLAFILTDQREHVRPGTEDEGDEPIDDVVFTLNSV